MSESRWCEAFEADGGVADAITLSAILAACVRDQVSSSFHCPVWATDSFSEAKGSSWEASMALFAGIRAFASIGRTVLHVRDECV